MRGASRMAGELRVNMGGAAAMRICEPGRCLKDREGDAREKGEGMGSSEGEGAGGAKAAWKGDMGGWCIARVSRPDGDPKGCGMAHCCPGDCCMGPAGYMGP